MVFGLQFLCASIILWSSQEGNQKFYKMGTYLVTHFDYLAYMLHLNETPSAQSPMGDC